MAENSQKFIARNRAPRVQIEYDVELYGAEKKIQLPFVMGVMSDLSGKSKEPLPAVEDRKFLEIDADNFDDRMRAMAPRAAFSVANTLTGEGALPVDLTFSKMTDFTPAAIAGQVAPLRDLLRARTELANLMTYMDGKAGAEALIETVLQDPALLGALAQGRAPGSGTDGALASLRAAAPGDVAAGDPSDEVLSALRATAPDTSDDPDPTVAALDALRAAAPEGAVPEDGLGDTLDALRDLTPRAESSGDVSDAPGDTLDALRQIAPAEAPVSDSPDAALDALRDGAVAGAPPGGGGLDDILGGLAAAPDPAPGDQPDSADVADVLADLAEPQIAEAGGGLDDILAGLDLGEPPAADAAADAAAQPDAAENSGGATSPQIVTPDGGGDPELDELMAAIAPAAADVALDDLGLDDLLSGDIGGESPPPEPVAIADISGPDDLARESPASADGTPGIDAGSAPVDDPIVGVDLDGLDDLLSNDAEVVQSDPFGTLSAPRPDAATLNRQRFRIALFGDFTGRAAKGQVEIGDALASRRAITLDVDTVDEVIAGFATTLVLPIGRDGAGIEVRLGELDDLHPDEIYDNVAVFAGLSALKQRLANGATSASAMADLRRWGADFATPVALPQRASAGGAVPADRKLSDFQVLIGDVDARLSQPSPIDDLIARVVGPHVVSVPDSEAVAAVDAALSSAMRLVLHHPEFQQIEAQWRTLDLMARRIETVGALEIVLYDVSAEEIAADLASAGDLSQSGLLRLLSEAPLDAETGRGGYSALFGLYTFEETPPHAELLGRIARVAAHLDAPFVAAISPAFIDTPKADRHPLVAQAWERLRAMPEAAHLGLATPRFMLRRPYGAKSDPISAFGFEEFTMQAGLGGMLWANPAALVAILMAQSFTRNGKALDLGSVMQLGDIPFHYVTDRYGDQVALPCTERNLTTAKTENVVTRGLMPVVSIRGRDEIRLASFQSLAGAELRGPWSGEPAPAPSSPTVAPDLVATFVPGPDAAEVAEAEAVDLDDLGLDDLLAGFGEPDEAPGDPEAVDADLAALLEGL